MTIRAVVLDIGGVLEVIDDDVFPGAAEQRLGLPPGAFLERVTELPGDAMVGEVTEAEVASHWQRCLDLDDARTAELMSDFWRWYVGTLDVACPHHRAARRRTARGAVPRRRAGQRRRRSPGWLARGAPP